MHRGWIKVKVHICIEVRSGSIVRLKVIDEKASDAPFLPALVALVARLLPGRIAGC